MKKSIFIVLPAFTSGNAVFLSLGMTCLLNLLSISVGISLDSKVQYPRLIPFCMILGIVALVLVVLVVIIIMIVKVVKVVIRKMRTRKIVVEE